jgi:hypothetical protein
MGIELRRLSRAERVIGVSALALFVALFFLPWYGGSASASLGNVSVHASLNGWHSFHSSRWLWLATIVLALAVVYASARALTVCGRVPVSVLVTALGGLSSALIAYRIVHHQSGHESGSVGGVRYSSSYGIQFGIWVGLLAAAGITYGGYLAMLADGTWRGRRRMPAL